LVPVSAYAAHGLALDAASNLFVPDGYSIFKYASNGTKSPFAAGLKYALGLCFDHEGKNNQIVFHPRRNRGARLAVVFQMRANPNERRTP
jgi:hypothetical protein